MEAVLSKTLLAGVIWRGVASALFSGVDLVALTRSTSDSFLAWTDSERRPAVAGAGSAVAVERRGLLMLLGAGPVEPLRLRFREEFSLPERRHNT